MFMSTRFLRWIFILRESFDAERRWRDREHLAGLQQALESGKDRRPSLGDGAEQMAALDETFMGHGQLHQIAESLEREGDLRRGFLSHCLIDLVLEGVGKPPRRIGFEDF